MEAVNQLLVALEVHRFDFCFIGAGYEKEVDEFLTVNPGLAGRFNRKLRFESYSPDELVEIAVRYGRPRASTIEPAALEALNAACRELRAYRAPDGAHGIDVMQNGRFARNVVERAERLRDSRVAAQHRTDRGSVTVVDLETIRAQDLIAAVRDGVRRQAPRRSVVAPGVSARRCRSAKCPATAAAILQEPRPCGGRHLR